MKKIYILIVYSFDGQYRKQIGDPSSNLRKLEKVQSGLDNILDSNKFYSAILEATIDLHNFYSKIEEQK